MITCSLHKLCCGHFSLLLEYNKNILNHLLACQVKQLLNCQSAQHSFYKGNKNGTTKIKYHI